MEELDPLQQIAAGREQESPPAEKLADEVAEAGSAADVDGRSDQPSAQEDRRLQRIEDYADGALEKEDHGESVIMSCNADLLRLSYHYHAALEKNLAEDGYSLAAFENRANDIRELRKIDNLIRQTHEATLKPSRHQADPLLQADGRRVPR